MIEKAPFAALRTALDTLPKPMITSTPSASQEVSLGFNSLAGTSFALGTPSPISLPEDLHLSGGSVTSAMRTSQLGQLAFGDISGLSELDAAVDTDNLIQLNTPKPNRSPDDTDDADPKTTT